MGFPSQKLSEAKLCHGHRPWPPKKKHLQMQVFFFLARVNEKDIFKNVEIQEVCFDPGYTANTEDKKPAPTTMTEKTTEQGQKTSPDWLQPRDVFNFYGGSIIDNY